MNQRIKSFIVKYPEDIPTIALDPAMIAHNFSDWHMAKIEGWTGRISYAIVAYNFGSGEWHAIQAGMKRLIEYYAEVPDTENDHQ